MAATGSRTDPTTTATPRWLPVDPTAIPCELTNDPAWFPITISPKPGNVGKWDKIPADPETGGRASWSDPSTWCSFGDAFMAYESGRFPGIGYVLHGSGVIGIDLDDCVSPDGTIAPWALEIVASFPGAYWERSISGIGLRGFCRGTLPDDAGGCRSKIGGCSVEAYTDKRVLVITGQAIRRVDGPLPVLQDAVNALHARLTAGRVRATGRAVRTGLVGRLETIPPDGMQILNAALSGHYGPRLMAIWGRDDLHATDVSEDDWKLTQEIAYRAIRAGVSEDRLALLVEQIMRAGPYRAKWDDPRNGTTWLAQTIANAVATVQQRPASRPAARPSHDDVVRDDVEVDPKDETAPVAETPEETIARLTRELTNAQAVIARQQQVIQTERATVERLNRLSYADSRLSRSTAYSPTQKEVIRGLARVATSRADWRDDDEVVITAEMLEQESGVGGATAGATAKLLCSLPGSPITRTTVPKVDGSGGKMTVYRLSTRDPNELLVGFVVVGDGLDGRLSNRPQRRRQVECPDHPGEPTRRREIESCAVDGRVLRAKTTERDADGNAVTAPGKGGSVATPRYPAPVSPAPSVSGVNYPAATPRYPPDVAVAWQPPLIDPVGGPAP